MPTQDNLREILLVEDNRGDVILVSEALKDEAFRRDGKPAVRLSVVEDGVQALDYLRRQGPYAEAAKPDMIILDLHLPKKNGLEVIREIKKDDRFSRIPIAVFTTSRSHRDVLKICGFGGSLFITKPLGFYEFMEAVKSIASMALGAPAA